MLSLPICASIPTSAPCESIVPVVRQESGTFRPRFLSIMLTISPGLKPGEEASRLLSSTSAARATLSDSKVVYASFCMVCRVCGRASHEEMGNDDFGNHCAEDRPSRHARLRRRVFWSQVQAIAVQHDVTTPAYNERPSK